jgi:tocopherol cyclase
MSVTIQKLNALFNPESFQGWGKKKKYFEGWYFKVVNESETEAYAYIPGIAMDENGQSHAFIQVLNGKQKTAEYHTFESRDFIPSTGLFKISIGSNHFSRESIALDLPGIKGHLEFSGNIPWPNKWYSPGIMGPYAFAPFLECYHGVVSMDHSLKGSLEINGKIVDFGNGRGYIEKDWGRSFPSAYIWIQTNHFGSKGISLKASVAKIPWLRSSFVGFIAGFYLGNQLIRFTTYNRSSLVKSRVQPGIVELELVNRDYRLEIAAHRDIATALASPIRGMMEGRIEESMTSLAEIRLTDRKSGELIFSDTGRNVSLEVAGNIEEIML